MPGGSGFLPQIVAFWELIVERAIHALLNRFLAIDLLQGLRMPVTLEHDVPPRVSDGRVDVEIADSQAEADFVAICRAHGFPEPTAAQYRVDLDGDATVADYAWPEKKVLIFIDGMPTGLHGDPRQSAVDRMRRAKARLKGWRVVEITAEALKDAGAMAVHLQEIAAIWKLPS